MFSEIEPRIVFSQQKIFFFHKQKWCGASTRPLIKWSISILKTVTYKFPEGDHLKEVPLYLEVEQRVTNKRFINYNMKE